MTKINNVAPDYDQAAEYDRLRDKGTTGDPGYGTEKKTPYVWTKKELFSRKEFQQWSGVAALDKFVEFEFVKPIVVWEDGGRKAYYSLHDLKKVRVMMALLDGKIDLKQAHQRAEAILSDETAQENEALKRALGLVRLIENPADPTITDLDEHPRPLRVTLCFTHADGTMKSKPLSGSKVPRLRDWEETADDLWERKENSQHGPIVRIWMEDESGQPYLRELIYQP